MKKFAFFVAALLMAAPALAADISLEFDSQGEFRRFSKDAAALLSYKNVAPAAPLGITGFDAGVEISAMQVSSGLWGKALGSDAPTTLAVPRVRVRKGLPLGIDVGAMFEMAPRTNIKVIGVELSKALLEGTAATPALGVRATYTKLLGVSRYGLQTVGLDASVSKGFVFVTPYAGAGMVYASSDPKDIAGFSKEEFWQPRVFGGVELKPLPLIRLVGDVEYSRRFIYTLKAAVGF